jgi:hypothetical protein
MHYFGVVQLGLQSSGYCPFIMKYYKNKGFVTLKFENIFSKGLPRTPSSVTV